jgi:hypothetical protein
MILNDEQIEDILSIVKNSQSIFIASHLGANFLTEEEKILLERKGFDIEKLYSESEDPIRTQFYLGLVAESIRIQEKDLDKVLTFDSFKEFVSQKKYIPLTELERLTIEESKIRFLGSIKNLNGKIYNDINSRVKSESLTQQMDILRGSVSQRMNEKKTFGQIASDLGHLTGDWNRDFDRIVQYEGQSAYELGKAAWIERLEENPKVYKIPQEKACKHCVRLYLSKGVGSEPKVFFLKELRENGTNIGKKVEDWKPVLGPVHPYCRCSLKHLRLGDEWEDEQKMFKLPENYQPKVIRKKIRAVIDGKEYWV